MSTQPIQSHFFTEPGSFTQSAAQAFGPVDATKFRLTAAFTMAEEKMAFAICKGVVLIQPQTGTNKVNLILRPYTQPIAGLNIKYFVYRGLKKSDFVNGPLLAPSEASAFVDKVRQDFLDFYNGSAPDLLSSYVGYDEDTDDLATRQISDYFFKKSELTETAGTTTETHQFELPMVNRGLALGHFATGACGVDVVLNYGDYRHDFDNGDFNFNLEYARAAEAAIVLSGTDIQKKLQREQSIQFIDIAAFYGMFASDGKVGATTGTTTVEKMGLPVYQDLVSLFTTKNNWYIYIQADRGRSYDYYGNYKLSNDSTTNLKKGASETTLIEATYGTEGWPILIDNTPQTPASPDDGKKKMFLQLVTDGNVNTMLYCSSADLENAQQDGFCNADDLKSSESKYTKILRLAAPAVDVDGGKGNVTRLTMLYYQGSLYEYKETELVDSDNVTTDVMAKPDFFDDIFDLVRTGPLIDLGTEQAFWQIGSHRLLLVNQYFDGQQQGIMAVHAAMIQDTLETGIADSPQLKRVTYVADTGDIMTAGLSSAKRITSAINTSPSASAAGGQYSLPVPFKYERKLFKDSFTITGLYLTTTDNSYPSKLLLGLTADENQLLCDLIDDGTKNPRIFLVNGGEYRSLEGVTYFKFKVGIVAEIDGLLRLLMPETPGGIPIYSLDRRYHFTKKYSDYMGEDRSRDILKLGESFTIESIS